jgi:hypothetical protein
LDRGSSFGGRDHAMHATISEGDMHPRGAVRDRAAQAEGEAVPHTYVSPGTGRVNEASGARVVHSTPALHVPQPTCPIPVAPDASDGYSCSGQPIS